MCLIKPKKRWFLTKMLSMTEEKHRIVAIESTILKKKVFFFLSHSIVISAHVMKYSNDKYMPTYVTK